jgi:hypothetical protein
MVGGEGFEPSTFSVQTRRRRIAGSAVEGADDRRGVGRADMAEGWRRKKDDRD